MKTRSNIWIGITASVCLLIIILDTKTAILGVLKGLEISVKVVIPSLFSFLILSYLISRSFSGLQIPLLKPLCRVLSIPQGAESIYLLGFVGGYPIGAKSMENAFRDGCISRSDAQRMLGFCSNAGPAFIFGMASSLFADKVALWVLWAIHIISSMLVGYLLPKHKAGVCIMHNNRSVSLPEAVSSSITTMGLICGWVIVFRVSIAFLQRWFMWLLPQGAQAALIGLLELSNGCSNLYNLSSAGLRFVLCATFLGFGGVCVAMQTVSVCKTLGPGMYFPGKLLQGIISFLLASITQFFLFNKSEIYIIGSPLLIILAMLLSITVLILYRAKKVVAITI